MQELAGPLLCCQCCFQELAGPLLCFQLVSQELAGPLLWVQFVLQELAGPFLYYVWDGACAPFCVSAQLQPITALRR